MPRLLRGVIAISLMIPAFAGAIRRPDPESGRLPEYDIRQRAIGEPSGSLGSDTRFTSQPTAEQRLGLKRLEASVEGRVVARFGGLANIPRMLFSPGGALTPARNVDPVVIARDFLRAYPELFRLSPAEIDALRVSKNYTTPGTDMGRAGIRLQ